MPIHPNSLANLRPAWNSETAPRSAHAAKIERVLDIGHNAGPKAIRLISRAMQDEDQPIGLRLRCAEYVVDKLWPKPAAGSSAEVSVSANGAEWLDVRFHFPGSDTKPNGHAETVRVSFDSDSD